MSAVREHHLPNGMTLMCCHQAHLHSVHFGLYLKGGSLYEMKQHQGICHLLEHLCFRGVGELDHEELNQLQGTMGAELYGATYPEGVVFTLSTLPRSFMEALRLFRRFFLCTPWTEEQIAQEKQVVLRQLEQEEEGFEDEVERRYRATQEGAFPVMGTEEVIRQLPPETIRLWQRMLFQPQNACLCLTGAFTKGMEAAAIALMSSLENYTEAPPFQQIIPLGFCCRDEHSDLIRDEEGGQAKVHIAFDIDREQVFPLQARVLDAITAGNMDSLLFQELREQQALVAEIESYIEETGAFQRLVITYDVRQEKLKESLRQVFTLLQRLRIYIRPARLMLLRTQFTDNLSMLLDSPSEMSEMMGWSWVAGDTSECDLEAQSAMYDEMTVEDLLGAAQAIFKPENLTLSIQKDPNEVGDLSALLQKLREMLA